MHSLNLVSKSASRSRLLRTAIKAASSAALLVSCVALCACTTLGAYRAEPPKLGDASKCALLADPPGASDCGARSTEQHDLFTMHVVEFDDEGAPFDSASSQIDSAIDQIRSRLASSDDCVRLFVYVHGWRHNADTADSNMRNFRLFLKEVADRSQGGVSGCDDPVVAASAAGSRKPGAPRRSIQTVGIYVGWRGLSIVDVKPWVYSSFWDRKNTADRVSQGSVRELLGRVSALGAVAPTDDKPNARRGQTGAQLRSYVIGHSFGASIVFRAMSQTLIDGFASDLDASAGDGRASVPRFVDMVVLVNPAIEAARFEPVFRAARKRKAYCDAKPADGVACSQPKYQAPVLAIFQSEGDLATKDAFVLGAGLSNVFESTIGDAERRAITHTVGWDDAYVTHRLQPASACGAGANAAPFEVAAGGMLRYRPPGWAWCFKDGSNPASFELRHVATTPESAGSKATYNGPLWNARVAPEIVKDHGDIWNAQFRAVLLSLFADQRVNPVFLNVASDKPALPQD